MKKLQVDVDPNSTRQMKAALDDLRGIRMRHDARILALVLLSQAATVYGHLKVLKHETDESLDSLFARALELAKTSTVQPKVELLGDLPSSEVPS